MKFLPQIIKVVRASWNGNWTATVLLLAFLVCGLTIASKFVHDLAMAWGFQTLRAATLELGRDIQSHVQSDQGLLEGLARIIGNFDAVDSPETLLILSSFDSSGMMSHLEILFPDDSVLLTDGSRINAAGRLSFAREAEQGVHISDLEEDLGRNGKKVLRIYAPIRKDGETAALLVGIVDVENLPRIYDTWAFGNQSHIYVVEGISGDFLVDTWHKELGNVNALGRRKAKPGNSSEQMAADIAAGRSGDIAFLSKTVGEYLYAHYEPVGVNHWAVVLSAPESIVFRNAVKVRAAFYTLAAFVLVVCGMYFAWMLLKARRQTQEKEILLRQVRCMSAVEKTLFDAHRTPARLGEALGKVADMMDAAWAFFLIFERDLGKMSRVWTDRGPVDENAGNEASLEDACPELYGALRRERSVSFASSEEALRECVRLCGRDAGRIMATLVENVDGTPAGVLGVADTRHTGGHEEYLKGVALSFSMAFHNIKSHQKIREMGMFDYLTGLLNRNSFQNAVSEYARRGFHSLACLYVDANGLHELNNSAGHEEGDRMLRCVATALKDAFGEEHAYRIGGDEFVVFAVDESEAEVSKRLKHAEQAIQVHDYHVSCGIAWRQGEVPVQDIVGEAERRMYEAKRRYYQCGRDRRGVR